jgi:hypothetical protein
MDRKVPPVVDLFEEPDGEPDTLANLGPLAPMAGTFASTSGHDVHPAAGGAEADDYVEHYVLEPIDRQTNGPQLLYGLRYHTHVVKPGEVETFHDQVGYWLWEPATEQVVFSLAIPRGQVVLAGGSARGDASEFTVIAERGSPVFGISSAPFLDDSFRTVRFEMTVTTRPDGTWGYRQQTVLEVAGRPGSFSHVDEAMLTRIAPPAPNPLAAG